MHDSCMTDALLMQVWWLSVWRGQATPGSELMNLRYRNEHAMEQAAAAAAAGAKAQCTSGLLQQQAPPWVSVNTVIVVHV
jgi:hypothetical protein